MLGNDLGAGEGFWHNPSRSLAQQQAFFAQHGAGVLSDESEQRQTFEWVRPAVRLTPLTEGQTVPLAGAEWQVLWLPGHSDDHLGLWQPELDLLIAGDAILPRITPNIGLYAEGRPDPLGDYFATLEQLRALNPARAVVGHHGPVLAQRRGQGAGDLASTTLSAWTNCWPPFRSGPATPTT